MRQVEEYIVYQASLGRSPQTLDCYRSRLKYFRDWLASREVYEARNITADLVRAYHAELIERRLTASSRHSYMATVQGFVIWLRDRGLVLEDIATRVELPELDHALPPTPLTEEEVARLMGAITGGGALGLRNLAILQLMYACGLRRGEVISLDVGDIDFEKALVYVRVKGDKDRVLPVNESALDCVARYLRARKHPTSGALFVTGRGNRIHARSLQMVFQRLTKLTGLHVHPHLLRHTFAVHMLRGGADVRHVQALLGHESPDTTSRYLGLVKDEIKAEYDRAMAVILEG